MGRHSSQVVPEREPTEEEVSEVAALFEGQRLAFMPYSTRIALRMHTADQPKLLTMLECWGGRVGPFSGTYRWLLYGDLLRQLLERVKPLLSEEGLRRVALAEQAMAYEKPTIRETEERVLGDFVRAKLAQARVPQGAVRHAPTPVLEVDAHIPPGPWDEDEPLLELVEEGPRVFQAGDEDSALRFAEVAAAAGFVVNREGSILHISKGEESE